MLKTTMPLMTKRGVTAAAELRRRGGDGVDGQRGGIEFVVRSYAGCAGEKRRCANLSECWAKRASRVGLVHVGEWRVRCGMLYGAVDCKGRGRWSGLGGVGSVWRFL